MNKILPSILITTLAFTSVVSFAQYASPEINCDELIRSTYANNARTNVTYVVTTENAQRCLADAGFYNYKDQNGKQLFTGKYWTATEQAAEAYMNRGNATTDAAKKAEAAKAEADRVAEQERQNLQKKADELKVQSQVDTQANTTNSTSATNNIASASTQALNTTNKSQVAIGGNSTIQDSREPASADKFLINSIYFLFALPFILFAISIIAAFLKVFKKPNE
jgi:23S rRNA pseudoU1915 N3-methylase RlmH